MKTEKGGNSVGQTASAEREIELTFQVEINSLSTDVI